MRSSIYLTQMASKKSFLSRLSPKQKLSLFFFVVLLISLPLFILAARYQQDLRSRAYTPTPIITTSSLPSAVKGTKYKATVLGIDSSGYGSALSMIFANLPAGFTKGPCQITSPITIQAGGSTTAAVNILPISPTKPTPTCVPKPTCPKSTTDSSGASNCQLPPPPPGTSYCETISITPTKTPTPIPPISITPPPAPTQISCVITGVPIASGTFKVAVILSNSHTGLVATKVLPLSVVQVVPTPSCKPRPACLDATPRCLIPETSDMCPRPTPTPPFQPNSSK